MNLQHIIAVNLIYIGICMYSYVLVRVNINTQTIRKGRKSASPPGASPFGLVPCGLAEPEGVS